MPTTREDGDVTTRWYPPKQYPAQLIMMTTDDVSDFVRTYAAQRGMPVTQVLRDVVQDWVDTLPPQTRQDVLDALSARDDEDEEEVAQGGR